MENNGEALERSCRAEALLQDGCWQERKKGSVEVVCAKEFGVVIQLDHTAAFIAMDRRPKMHCKESLKKGFFGPRMDNRGGRARVREERVLFRRDVQAAPRED